MFETNFAALDWTIVATYIFASVAIGMFVNRYIHSVDDFLVGGRGSGTSLNVATYIGTGLGLVTLMYASMDAFTYGFAYVTVAVIGTTVGLLLGSTGFVIARLREMKLTTIPEFFERHYDRKTRIIAGIICAVAGILNMGLFPRMGATFITYATGLGSPGEAGNTDELSVTIKLITTLLVVLVIAYTVIGGMVSVIVTDYIQFVVLSIGLAIGVAYCLLDPALGWSQITHALAEEKGLKAFNPVAEDSYGWTWVAWMILVFFGAALVWAPEATRMLTTPDARTTRRTFLFAAPGQFVRIAIPALFAVAAFTWVRGDADLTRHFFPNGLSESAEHADQAMPLLLGQLLPSGLLGLLVAGLMAAFMSTHDSYLLGWASIITRDVIAPIRRQPLSDRGQILTTRLVIVGIGAALIFIGLWMPKQASIWSFMALTGTIYISGALPALLGGLYWSRASRWGARAAMLSGFLALTALIPNTKIMSINPKIQEWFTTPNICLATYLIAAIVFVTVSMATPDPTPRGQEGVEP